MSRTLVRLKEELEKIPATVVVTRSRSKTESRSLMAGGIIQLPSSREARMKLYEEIIGRSRPPESIQRCRPKLPIIAVKSIDPESKETTTIDVSYLQDYPDRLDALRECIEIMFQSTTEVYKRLDLNGCGQLPFDELMKGLKRLQIPWQQVTGLTRAELLKLVGSGPVDLLTFLGRTQLTSRPHWSQLSLKDQWEDYCNKVIDLDLGNTSCSPPLWSGMTSSAKSNSIRTPSTVSTPLSREDLDYIQSKIVRIEKFLGDFVEHKRDLMKLKHELSSVTESEDKAAEIKRKREEEEREKQRIKRAAGMALVSTDGINKISIFGNRNNLSVFSEPSKDQLVDAFSGIVGEEERRFRELLNDVGLSLFMGDKIRSALKRATNAEYPQDISQKSFETTISNLLSVPPTQHRMVSDWVSLSQGRSCISIRDFLSFCSKPETGIYV